MTVYLIDTSALLTLRDDEPGADRVAEIFSQSAHGEIRCLGCFMSRMELFYRVWKDEGETEARLAYEQCLSLPIEWLEQNEEMLQRAAAIKAKNTLSLADAWIAACAEMHDAVLVHKDPEFKMLQIKQELLPLKVAGR